MMVKMVKMMMTMVLMMMKMLMMIVILILWARIKVPHIKVNLFPILQGYQLVLV